MNHKSIWLAAPCSGPAHQLIDGGAELREEFCWSSGFQHNTSSLCSRQSKITKNMENMRRQKLLWKEQTPGSPLSRIMKEMYYSCTQLLTIEFCASRHYGFQSVNVCTYSLYHTWWLWDIGGHPNRVNTKNQDLTGNISCPVSGFTTKSFIIDLFFMPPMLHKSVYTLICTSKGWPKTYPGYCLYLCNPPLQPLHHSG